VGAQERKSAEIAMEQRSEAAPFGDAGVEMGDVCAALSFKLATESAT